MNNPPVHLSSFFLAICVSASLATLAYSQAPASPAAGGLKPAPAPAGGAPSSLGGNAKAASGLSAGEQKFIKDASEGILVEQKFADLAGKTAGNEAVKKSGDSINGELKKVWEQLATLATAKNAKMALEVKKSDATKAESLGKMKPDKFDKEWLKEISKETKKTAHAFEAANKSAQDPDLKKFLVDWTPTITSHDTDLTRLERELAAKKK